MMKVTVCIGSSCHLKGSRIIIESIQKLIEENQLQDKVNLGGTFCLGECSGEEGVNVTVDGKIFSVKQEEAEEFFKREVVAKL